MNKQSWGGGGGVRVGGLGEEKTGQVRGEEMEGGEKRG